MGFNVSSRVLSRVLYTHPPARAPTCVQAEKAEKKDEKMFLAVIDVALRALDPAYTVWGLGCRAYD